MALMCMVSTILYAQKIEASGTVVDQTGETIIGASILEKGTSNGTITDLDGNFKFMANSGAKIIVSYIGYLSQELTAGNRLWKRQNKTWRASLWMSKHTVFR